MMVLRLRITNNEHQNLKNVRIKYYLQNNNDLNVDIYDDAGKTITIDTINSEIIALTIAVGELPVGLFPYEAGMCFGIYRRDWGSYDKFANYSYVGSENFKSNTNVAVYVEDSLVYGLPVDFAEPEVLPNASSNTYPSGTKILKDSDNVIHFVWNQVGYAEMYRLVVYDKDTNMVYETETSRNMVPVALDTGTYYWKVESGNRYMPLPDAPSPTIKPGELNVISYITEEYEPVAVDSFDVETLRGAKDTPLLYMNYGEYTPYRNWDHVDETIFFNPEEVVGARCWAIAIQMMYRYYKKKLTGINDDGDLTQDEIAMYVKAENDNIYEPFQLYDGGLVEEDKKGLKWALNLSEDDIHLHKIGEDNLSNHKERIKFFIQNRMPVFIASSGTRHVMVVCGFQEFSNGNFYLKRLNADNYGTVDWIEWKTVLQESSRNLDTYIAVETPRSVLLTNPLVHTDSDGDGLVDYDEIYRFHTCSGITTYDPDYCVGINPRDSDGDGIEDKVEIYSYTVRTHVPNTKVPQVVEDHRNEDGYPYMWFFFSEGGLFPSPLADIDGDGYRAELDSDSDGDGILDGDEDLNHNGIVDEGETDPYVADDASLETVAVPRSIALYSFDYVMINDGSKIQVRKAGSSIASENVVGPYGVRLGVRASVKDIYAKNRAWLRNYASAEQVHYYGAPDKIFNTELQDNAKIGFDVNMPKESWPWTLPHQLSSFDVGSVEKIVKNGEVFTLKDESVYRLLKVEFGGTLQIESGTMHVGTLQLDAGSKVKFSEPGYRTDLHVKETLLWNAKQTVFSIGSTIAKGFRLTYHGTSRLDIAGEWAGSLIAPYAKIVLGQGEKSKVLYGQFLGNGITVHQYSTIFYVLFDPLTKENQMDVALYEGAL
ncbi:MAG: hypothetical protein K6E57_07175 [Fibrobacter sp.]|nr:hypothetical protein [Fibrobacter sp.]